jgi:hypothetical protein
MTHSQSAIQLLAMVATEQVDPGRTPRVYASDSILPVS